MIYILTKSDRKNSHYRNGNHFFRHVRIVVLLVKIKIDCIQYCSRVVVTSEQNYVHNFLFSPQTPLVCYKTKQCIRLFYCAKIVKKIRKGKMCRTDKEVIFTSIISCMDGRLGLYSDVCQQQKGEQGITTKPVCLR